MVQVYRRIGTLRTVASYSAWIYAIVRHECQRLLRQMHRRPELPEEDAPIFARQSNFGLQIDLAAAIESLPHKYREAIILRDCEERSITEIAESLQLTRAAVKSRIHHARLMIRDYLKD